jgi:hypothetical protein
LIVESRGFEDEGWSVTEEVIEAWGVALERLHEIDQLRVLAGPCDGMTIPLKWPAGSYVLL